VRGRTPKVGRTKRHTSTGTDERKYRTLQIGTTRRRLYAGGRVGPPPNSGACAFAHPRARGKWANDTHAPRHLGASSPSGIARGRMAEWCTMVTPPQSQVGTPKAGNSDHGRSARREERQTYHGREKEALPTGASARKRATLNNHRLPNYTCSFLG